MSVITLYTDASYHNGIGGGAYWCRADDLRTNGVFPIYDAKCSGQAETVTAIHAAILVLEDPAFALARFNCIFVIVTDCMSTKHYMERGGGSFDNNRTIRTLRAKLKHMEQAYGIEMRVNHVKAHTGGRDKRSWINEWCDIHSKQARRDAIQGVKAFNKANENMSRRKPNGNR